MFSKIWEKLICSEMSKTGAMLYNEKMGEVINASCINFLSIFSDLSGVYTHKDYLNTTKFVIN